jgi:hypothetical protein
MVMMENRSFDHMLGALRYSRFGGRVDVDGLTSEANPQYQNFLEGRGYQRFHMLDGPLPCDLPTIGRLWRRRSRAMAEAMGIP